jgi:hypothetical protein
MAHVKNIAIIGVSLLYFIFTPIIIDSSTQATGTVGTFIVDALLKTGQHQLTAITRVESDAVIPNGIKVAKVNYDDHSSLVKALEGQEVLIITMNVRAPKDQQIKLVDAAAEAGVPWILPNEWGGDQTNEALCDDIFLGPPSRAVRKHIEDLGKSSWIGIASNFCE